MSSILDQTLAANMMLLESRLCDASITTSHALRALREGKRNQAIGTLMPLETEIARITALFQTILTLHQLPDTLPQKEGASCQ